MKEVLIGMIAVCCCICCTWLKEIAAPEKESEDNAWEGPGVNIAGTDTVHVCYISGIDYPKGWNWADASDGTEEDLLRGKTETLSWKDARAMLLSGFISTPAR